MKEFKKITLERKNPYNKKKIKKYKRILAFVVAGALGGTLAIYHPVYAMFNNGDTFDVPDGTEMSQEEMIELGRQIATQRGLEINLSFDEEPEYIPSNEEVVEIVNEETTIEEAVAEPEKSIEDFQESQTLEYSDTEFFDLSHLENTNFKGWMGADTITDETSLQYKLVNMATPDEYGIMRIDGLPLIALGTKFAPKCGYRYLVTLSTGEQFEAISADVKADRDTDPTNTFRWAGPNWSCRNVIEFIMNGEHYWGVNEAGKDVKIYTGIIQKIKTDGQVSNVIYGGDVLSIEKLGLYEFDKEMGLS